MQHAEIVITHRLFFHLNIMYRITTPTITNAGAATKATTI